MARCFPIMTHFINKLLPLERFIARRGGSVSRPQQSFIKRVIALRVKRRDPSGMVYVDGSS